MSLSTSLVDIENITSRVLRSDFSEVVLEDLAKLILESRGLVRPIILKRTGIETFEIIDGHFEYYATARAREIDPAQFEMVRAFIVEPENEEIVKAQAIALRERETFNKNSQAYQSKHSANPNSRLPVELTSSTEEIQQIKILLQQLDRSLQGKVDDLARKVDQVNESVRKLEGVVSEQPREQAEAIHHDIDVNEPQTTNYASMTILQLKKILKQRGLKNYSKMKKAQLIAALTRNQKA